MAKIAVKKKPVAKAPVKKAPPPKAKPQLVEKPKAVAGHNSGVDGKLLKSVVERVVRLEEEKRGLTDDVKEIIASAKEKGLVPKIIRKLVAIELADKEKLREEKEMLDQYLFALDPELADVLS